jgi:F0F1-type ATP synthase beta subunit
MEPPRSLHTDLDPSVVGSGHLRVCICSVTETFSSFDRLNQLILVAGLLLFKLS